MRLERSSSLPPPPLFNTLCNEGIDAVAAAVAGGANINAKDSLGATLLYQLCVMRPDRAEDRHAQFSAIRRLLALGASPNTPTNFDLTPFYVLCDQEGDPELFELLETMLTPYGADINILGKNGKTALHCAVIEQHKSMLDFLIAHGANPSLCDASVESPLHVAARHEDLTFLRTLITHGADLDAYNKLGNTPLHVACGWGATAAAELLLAAGARRDIRNANGHTPYGYQFSAASSPSLPERAQEFTKHLLLPTLLASSDISHPLLHPWAHKDEKLKRHYDKWVRQLSDTVARSLCPEPQDTGEKIPSALLIQEYLRPMRIAHTWWRSTIGIPSGLLPLRNGREWMPYMQEDFVATNGFRVHCLTRSADLGEMSQRLELCVGRRDYDSRCCNGTSHILSISTPHGRPVSIVELGHKDMKTQPLKKGAAPPVADTIRQPSSNHHVLQHDGYDHFEPPTRAQAALEEFLQARGRGMLHLNEMTGETMESKARYFSLPFLHREIGFVPSKAAVEAVYDEYRLDYRRAMRGKFDDRSLVYDDEPGEDGYIHRNHFIRGYVVVDAEGKPVGSHALTADGLHTGPGERILDLRQLDAMSYLRATGLLEKARSSMRAHMPELATQLENAWKEQDRLPLTKRVLPVPQHKLRRELREYHDRVGAQDTREQAASSNFARY